VKCPVCGAAHAVCGGPALLTYPPIGQWRTDTMPQEIASERLYVNAAGEIVPNDDPGKVTLVAAAGAPIPARYADAYSAYQSAQAPAQDAAAPESVEADADANSDDAEAPEPKSKAVAAAPKNKAVTGPRQSKSSESDEG